MVTALKVAEAARGFIEKGFTKGAFGRDASGKSVPMHQLSETAVCFCTLGAVRAAFRTLTTPKERLSSVSNAFEVVYAVEIALSNALGSEALDVAFWNDHSETTQDDVLNLFTKVIEDLRCAS